MFYLFSIHKSYNVFPIFFIAFSVPCFIILPFSYKLSKKSFGKSREISEHEEKEKNIDKVCLDLAKAFRVKEKEGKNLNPLEFEALYAENGISFSFWVLKIMMKFDKCKKIFIKVINCIVSFCNLTYCTKIKI